MLNQPCISMSYLRSEEKEWYGNEEISHLIVLNPNPINNNFYVVTDASDLSDIDTYYCKKQKRNYFGQTWFAYDNNEGKGTPVAEAYTFRNLKGMLV